MIKYIRYSSLLVCVLVISMALVYHVFGNYEWDSNNLKNRDLNIIKTVKSKPKYKLHESIRSMFRSEWVWNEEKQEYDNIKDGLIRNPETGLFAEPSPRKDMEGYAHWDGLLGMYVINEIKINHETGDVVNTHFENGFNSMPKPIYIPNLNDLLDQKIIEYKNVYDSQFESDTKKALLSIYYCPYYFLKEGILDREWFTIDINDLMILKGKLLKGWHTDLALTIIQITTNVEMNAIANSCGDGSNYLWLKEFNSLIKKANEGFSPNEAKKLGYLSLPYIEEQLRRGDSDGFQKVLPDIADGFMGTKGESLKSKNEDEMLQWFDKYQKEIDILRDFISEEIELYWEQPPRDY